MMTCAANFHGDSNYSEEQVINAVTASSYWNEAFRFGDQDFTSSFPASSELSSCHLSDGRD